MKKLVLIERKQISMNMLFFFLGIREFRWATVGYSTYYSAMLGIEEDIGHRGATLITVDEKGFLEIAPYRLMDLSS